MTRREPRLPKKPRTEAEVYPTVEEAEERGAALWGASWRRALVAARAVCREYRAAEVQRANASALWALARMEPSVEKLRALLGEPRAKRSPHAAHWTDPLPIDFDAWSLVVAYDKVMAEARVARAKGRALDRKFTGLRGRVLKELMPLLPRDQYRRAGRALAYLAVAAEIDEPAADEKKFLARSVGRWKMIVRGPNRVRSGDPRR